MGVFSRTMLMLTMAWLVGLIVTFAYLQGSTEDSWRDKFIAEANIRRALAYRTVDLRGGTVADRGHSHGLDSDNQGLLPENLATPPYGLPDENASAPSGDEPLPGAKVHPDMGLIALEKESARTSLENFRVARQGIEERIDELRDRIAEAQSSRRTYVAKLADVREEAQKFAATMMSYRYIIASSQQKVFNLDYEIKRAMIERDALTAELAQVRNDIERIEGQQITLENSAYDLSKDYEKVIKLLAWYEQAEPNLRTMADSTGRPWLRGKVVGVGDDPRTGVVSISIGENEGVFEGQSFSIYRKDRFIGRMVVENVRKNIAVGRLAKEFRGKQIVMVQDSVKTAEPFSRGR